MVRPALRMCGLVVAGYAAVLGPTTAQAATVVTYGFVQAGYLTTVQSAATGPGTLTGTFTGVVNPLGQFQLHDLSAFSLNFAIPTVVGTSSGPFGGLGDLSLFSFNTTSGSDLLIISQDNLAQGTCVGAAATLSPFCNPGGNNPAGTLGALLLTNVVVARTTQAPIITLVSSVTTPGAVPEPSTWAMMLLGFGFVGAAMRSHRRQKPTGSHA